MAGSAPYYWAARNAWYVNVTVDGKRTKRYLGKTKREALEAYKRLYVLPSKSGVAFATVGAAWLKHQLWRAQRGEVSQDWLQRVNRTIERFGDAHDGLAAPNATSQLIYDWLGDVSPSYVRTEMAAIRQCLKWAVESKMLEVNPLQGVKLPSESRRQRILSLETHNKLCCHAARPMKRLLRVAWLTGCRPVELRRLKWEHLADDYSSAKMPGKSTRVTGKPRVIYFPKRARQWLRAMRARSESEHVFTNTRGNPWTRNALVIQMRRIRERAGVEAVAYDYRHTWITRALVAGVDIATVAELAGHSSTAMVSRVYSHLDQENKHLSDAVDRVG